MKPKIIFVFLLAFLCLKAEAQKEKYSSKKFTITAVDSATGIALDSVKATIKFYVFENSKNVKTKMKENTATVTFNKKYSLKAKAGGEFEIEKLEKEGYETQTFAQQTTEKGKDYYSTYNFKMKKKKTVRLIEVE